MTVAAWPAPADGRLRASDGAVFCGQLDIPTDLALLVAGGIGPDLVLTAAAEAERTGAAPLDVLLCGGEVRDTEIAAVLARELGTRVALGAADLADAPGPSAEHLAAGLRSGMLPLGTAPDRPMLVAVRGRATEKLADLLSILPAHAGRVVLAPGGVFDAFVRERLAAVLGAAASDGPARLDPRLSAATLDLAPGSFALASLVLAGMVLAVPSTAACVVELVLGAAFLVSGLVRCAAIVQPRAAVLPCRPALADRELPTYTVLVPLYREARLLPAIVATMAELDYPAAKLQVLFLLEADDAATIAAARSLDPRPPFDIVVVPPCGPKTKPKALNIGLLHARGSLLTVFDAEDRPEPGQLRIAAERLCRGPRDLACVQAALAIDNARPRPLARMFFLDYAALFDVFLPAIGALGLPCLLGGTSNHFRTEILRRCGGWDAHNVTEDADLGIRLARFGYRVESIASTTFEEAPADLWPWIRQRTRWMKGFLVTWAVHARNRRALRADLGWRKALVAEVMLAATPLAALAHLGLFFIVPAQLASGGFLSGRSAFSLLADSVALAAVAVGYAAAVMLIGLGLFRRRRLDLLPWIAALPVYWCLMAFAALRAVSQLGKGDRSDWEKTEHGRELRLPLPAAERTGRRQSGRDRSFEPESRLL